jgi:hypothetical protein
MSHQQFMRLCALCVVIHTAPTKHGLFAVVQGIVLFAVIALSWFVKDTDATTGGGR